MRRDRAAEELVRGEIALADGDAAAALAALEVSARLWPYSYTRVPLARAQNAAGQWERAVSTYQEVVRDSAIGWEVQEAWLLASYELGRLYESRGDTGNAIASYRRFVQRWAAGDDDLVALADARRRLSLLTGTRKEQA